MSDTRPAPDTPEELIWLRGYEAGVIDMRADAKSSGSHHNTSTSVRELEWELGASLLDGVDEMWFFATGPIRYSVHVRTNGQIHAFFSDELTGSEHSTLEEAKAACQSDFQKRITECLEPTASGWWDIESAPKDVPIVVKVGDWVGTVRLNSIPNIQPYRWHEEWAHTARSALSPKENEDE